MTQREGRSDEGVIENGRRTQAVLGTVSARLKPTSFKLLCYLAEFEGQWIGTATLRERVLGTHFAQGASNLRWHILQIRKSLGVLAAFVHSDNRLGFMFAMESCERIHCIRDPERARRRLGDANRQCGIALGENSCGASADRARSGRFCSKCPQCCD